MLTASLQRTAQFSGPLTNRAVAGSRTPFGNLNPE